MARKKNKIRFDRNNFVANLERGVVFDALALRQLVDELRLRVGVHVRVLHALLVLGVLVGVLPEREAIRIVFRGVARQQHRAQPEIRCKTHL